MCREGGAKWRYVSARGAALVWNLTLSSSIGLAHLHNIHFGLLGLPFTSSTAHSYFSSKIIQLFDGAQGFEAEWAKYGQEGPKGYSKV